MREGEAMRRLAESLRNQRISGEVLCLLFLCILDTVSSAILFHSQLAVEANPLLRPYAEMGVIPFVLVKVLTFVPAVVFIEAVRPRNPHFFRSLARVACAVYAGIYLTGVGHQFFGA